ncbi:MAG: hypothetical protein ACLRYY_14605 [Anaerobutyricum soehngenii]
MGKKLNTLTAGEGQEKALHRNSTEQLDTNARKFSLVFVSKLIKALTITKNINILKYKNIFFCFAPELIEAQKSNLPARKIYL